ncbi:hypothetical protein QBC34DRAFT_433127 [Podospora aff. communis PSN243]|uniref:F-box domain-containing protein n=1 Tax=Podospora aff. communis PSN243 TaxID=3040156 RepID=A0AAV9H4F8_9PEZI|nr:hypothetical protein QBC34DRAFT_433127 [Podospora aff. communis PSN243]
MSLSSVPAEVLEEITEHLSPSRLCYENDFKPDAEYHHRRAALVALSKTNRRLNAFANKVLYRTLDATVGNLGALLKTLVVHARLQELVRVLNITWPVSDDEEQPDTYSITYPHWEAVWRTAMVTGGADFLCWHYDETACAFLVTILGNVEAVYLVYSPCETQGSGYDMYESLERALFLHTPRLLCISRAGGPIDEFLDEPEDWLVSAESVQPLLYNTFLARSTGPRELELRGAMLSVKGTLDSFQAGSWSNLEAIKIEDSFVTGPWFHRLCYESRPRLKRVDISITPYLREAIWEHCPGSQEPGYNGALALCASTLRYLRLDNISSHELGKAGALTCLPGLIHLKYLEADPEVIFDWHPMKDADVFDHLPPSLEVISLRDDFCKGERRPESDEWAAENSLALRRIMLQLVLGSEQKIPRLRKVQISYDPLDETTEIWNLDEEVELQGLYSVEVRPLKWDRRMIDCATLQGKSM